jgi:hypothetical protein
MPLIIQIVILFVFGVLCFMAGLYVGFGEGFDKCMAFMLQQYDPEQYAIFKKIKK